MAETDLPRGVGLGVEGGEDAPVEGDRFERRGFHRSSAHHELPVSQVPAQFPRGIAPDNGRTVEEKEPARGIGGGGGDIGSPGKLHPGVGQRDTGALLEDGSGKAERAHGGRCHGDGEDRECFHGAKSSIPGSCAGGVPQRSATTTLRAAALEATGEAK